MADDIDLLLKTSSPISIFILWWGACLKAQYRDSFQSSDPHKWSGNSEEASSLGYRFCLNASAIDSAQIHGQICKAVPSLTDGHAFSHSLLPRESQVIGRPSVDESDLKENNHAAKHVFETL